MKISRMSEPKFTQEEIELMLISIGYFVGSSARFEQFEHSLERAELFRKMNALKTKISALPIVGESESESGTVLKTPK